MRGFGDLVAFVLTPLQSLIKRFYGKKDCGCKKRQEALNRLLPFSDKGLTEQQVKDWNERRDRRFQRKTPPTNNS
jgi:hypothetical protein